MKTFILYWLDGTKEIIKGETICEAFGSRYARGAIKALKRYEVVKDGNNAANNSRRNTDGKS